MATKICPCCKKEKPLSEFYNDKRNSIGKTPQCKCCLLIKSNNYYNGHKEGRRQYTRDNGQRVKQIVLSHYSGGEPKCAKCGFKDIRALSIDHINGGGNKQRRTDGLLGANFYKWLIRQQDYPQDLQVLCMNCQFIKRMEGKESRMVTRRRVR